MADFFQTGVYGGTGNKDLTVADHTNALGPGTSTNFDTGDLRRKYNFGDRVSELAIAQDPFFRFLSKVAKKPVDDPEFKWAEKRPSFHKRYAYAGAILDSGAAWDDDSDFGGAKSVGDTAKIRMIGDYKHQGNIQNVFNNTANDFQIGASGTMPKFFLPGHLVKIPMAASAGGAVTDYLLVRVNSVTEYSANGSANDATITITNNPAMVELDTTVVKTGSSGNARYLSATASIDDGGSTVVASQKRIHDQLEPMRCYVVGSAYTEGSGYPETWKDQPYATNIGLTQIWKTSMAMTNTARATSLKYDSNEWARIWKEKLVEHKWDLETSLLFGSQYTDTTNDIKYTQGAIDYVVQYGNQFSLTIATKTADDFLDDMSNYVDPRYNQSTATLFFCNTAVYNWLHKLGGYFKNNLEISSNFRSDMALTGKKKVFGVDISTFSTPYGDINVARNIHLDGTNVKMMGINMKNCSWRPLVGNGINRDTSVYVGVQTLENSGVDRRVDLILTEGGMEWSMAESHAIWT